ncbi:MAG TPA: ElyC/SanA/YdcF family protein, partial [Thermoanaerobaculia bacterium]
MLTPIARGLALFLGGFTLLNLAGDLRFRGPGANIWWLDVPLLPARVSQVLLALIAVLLITYAFAPRVGRWRLACACIVLGAAILAAFANGIAFYVLLGQRRITSSFPLPLSIIVAATLILILTAHTHVPEEHRFVFATAFVLAGIAFPLAQISLFGLTDYRRPADLVVVFGARANSDGSASAALADRVRTACALYHAGLAQRLLLSGGPGEGPVDEPESMRRLART